MVKLSEAQHQAAVMKWSCRPENRSKWPELALLHHIPNGGTRDAIEGRHLKQQGVKPGVPDLCLPVPSGRYHGLYIEMKTGAGRASEAQKWWIERLNDAGYFAEVCHGWQSAVQVLEWYLSLKMGEKNEHGSNVFQ